MYVKIHLKGLIEGLMSKICSLDFLNKEEFDLDIVSTGGKTLFSKGDKVAPEEIEIKKKTKSQKIDQTFSFLDLDKAMEELLERESSDNLEFDKAHAKGVMQLSCNLGLAIGMSDEKIEELKQASYCYKIGRIKLALEDLMGASFEKKQADIGYNLLTLEMKMSKQVAEVTKMYLMDYNCAEFALDADNPSDVSYAHIVAIVDYYDKLIGKGSVSKDEALDRMLKLEGNKFNNFVLQKFVNIMRDLND